MVSIFLVKLFKVATALFTEQITKWKETLKVDADALKYGDMYIAYYNQMYTKLHKYYEAVEIAYNATKAKKDKAEAIYKNLLTETTKKEMCEEYYKSQNVTENGYVVDNLQETQALSKKSYEALKEMLTNSPYNDWNLTPEKLNTIHEVLKEALALSKKAYDAVQVVAMEKDTDSVMYVNKETYKEACFNAKKALDNARELTYDAHEKAWFDNKNGKTYRKLYRKQQRTTLWLTYFSLRVYLLFDKHY